MRFVHTETLKMVENPKPKEQDSTLRYGILSHRWESEEVTLQEMQSGQALQEYKKGFQKIQMCCRQARENGLDFVWIDTCCIDKTSSSELQEAINSMFQWYRDASICYAYLFDVQINPDPSLSSLDSFQDSVWFERGWTLQELLAPTEMVFYGERWCKLGSKNSLKHELSTATGISLSVLEGEIRLQDISVAERMSWASKRKTERIEDRAYSLLGIFDVSMPMLYGEGKKAFRRLQEEIIRHSDDHTIFAWKGINAYYPGMLASEPENFASCQDSVNIRSRQGRTPFSFTNRGLSITLKMAPYTIDTYLALIHCDTRPTGSKKDGGQCVTGIFLRRLDEDDQYARVSVFGEDLLLLRQLPARPPFARYRDMTVLVRQVEIPANESSIMAMERVGGFRINSDLLWYDSQGRRLFKIDGNLRIGHGRVTAGAPRLKVIGIVGNLIISKQRRTIEEIALGFDFEFNPVCILADGPQQLHDNNKSYVRIVHEIIEGGKMEPGSTINKVNKQGYKLWGFKGDRLNGLDASFRLYGECHDGDFMTVTMKRETIDERIGWVFGMNNDPKEFWTYNSAEINKDARIELVSNVGIVGKTQNTATTSACNPSYI